MSKINDIRKTGLIVETVERVVHDQVVYILGEKYDVYDLYETLLELEEDPESTYITNGKMENMLREIGVLKGNSPISGVTIEDEALDDLLDLVQKAINSYVPKGT